MTEKIIDTHVHFFDMKHPKLRYDWLQPDFVHPELGDIDAMKAQRFDLNSMWAEARFADVEAFVHVQAAIGSADPVDETRWLTEMQDEGPAPVIIVAHADLDTDRASRQLDGHAESPFFVGVRDFAAEPYLASGQISGRFESSLKELTKRGLVLDLDCAWQNMGAARALAERHPELQIVLEHIGFPRQRDDSYFGNWRAAIQDLSLAPNVTCKVSGIGMTDTRGVYADYEPWITTCLEAFGTDRCVVGSNWPLGRLVSSYDAVMLMYRRSVETLSDSEQAAFLNGTARRIYKLDAVVAARV
jgi:predicted TIM-barrel fold metal-dependent hydrolase